MPPFPPPDPSVVRSFASPITILDVAAITILSAHQQLVPITLLWAVFACVWEGVALGAVSSTGHAAPAFFPLFGLPFVAIGLYGLVGRFFYRAHRKRRTVFALTDRRVLSLLRRPGGEALEAAFISTIPVLNTRVTHDGSGTLVFGSAPWLRGLYANSGLEFLTRQAGPTPISFYDVPDVARVAAVVEQLRSDHTASSLPERGDRADAGPQAMFAQQGVGAFGGSHAARPSRSTWQAAGRLRAAGTALGARSRRPGWPQRALLAGLIVLAAVVLPTVLTLGPGDTCVSKGIATPAGREGICVRTLGLLGASTTYNVVDSGHTLHMPGYDVRLLSSTSRVTTVTGGDTADYPGGTGLLVSYLVSITNTQDSPLLFDTAGQDTDLALPYRPNDPNTPTWGQVLQPQGAPTPQVGQQGPIPAHTFLTGWLTFVVPLKLEQYLNTRPADLEFYRPGQERGYVGQIRLWKYASSEAEKALQANPAPPTASPL
ncbi:MAG: hypothetical protein ACYDHH_11745 [Solirubrobacteraceae bacterium]